MILKFNFIAGSINFNFITIENCSVDLSILAILLFYR